MKYKISLSLSALCFFMAFLLLLSCRMAAGEQLAASISPKILRFHVLAEDNSPRNQELKLEVKSLLLSYIQEHSPKNAGKEELSHWLLEEKEVLEQLASELLLSKGASPAVSLQLAHDHFPTKTYGSVTFPGGTYDALRIVIGNGNGKNWWCVLYPSLCAPDAVQPSMPEASQATLDSLLPDPQYKALLPRPALLPDIKYKKPEIRVRLRLSQLFKFDA